jgi:hypothetical protein
MYMTCTHCRTPWCWQCGQFGANIHHVFECNKPPDEKWGQLGDGETDMKRYLFYFERYHNHKVGRFIRMRKLPRASCPRVYVRLGCVYCSVL